MLRENPCSSTETAATRRTNPRRRHYALTVVDVDAQVLAVPCNNMYMATIEFRDFSHAPQMVRPQATRL